MMIVDDAEKMLGVELMPWQRDLAQAILDGKTVVWVKSRRGGNKVVARVVEKIWTSGEGN